MKLLRTTILLLLVGTVVLSVSAAKKMTEKHLKQTQEKVYKRVLKDAEMVKSAIGEMAIPGASKAKYYKMVEEVKTVFANKNYPKTLTELKSFRTIIPFNAEHAKIFQAYSATLRDRGFRGLKIWPYGRFDYFGLNAEPEDDNLEELSLMMMRNEQRSAAFNLTNCTAKEQPINISLTDIPQGCKVELYYTAFVDTKNNKAIPSALLKAKQIGKKWSFKLHSGMTTQVWVKFYSGTAKAGEYQLPLTVALGRVKEHLDFELNIVPINFPVKPRYSLHMFDYSSTGWAYAVDPTNQLAVIKDLRSHLVKNYTMHSAEIPGLGRKFYDKNGKMIKQPNCSTFITNIKKLPADSDRYILFLALRRKGSNFIFAGFPPGSAAGNEAVKQWLKFMTKTVEKIGIAPDKIYLHAYDEPREDDYLHALYNFFKLVKENSKISTFCTTGADGAKNEYCAKSLKYTDVSQVARPHAKALFGENRELFMDFAKQPEKELWFYECGYKADFKGYVAGGWYDALNGASGSGYWSYGDTGGNPSNWNMYPKFTRDNYSPLYIDATTVTNSREWEGIMESLENGEYVLMLRDKLKQRKSAGKAVSKLEKLLASRPPRDSKKSNKLRLKILNALQQR